MGKPTICIGENKGADQIAVTAKLISAFVFATRTVQFLLYLTPKFQAASSFLCLYRPVCVGPVRKPHCRFSHEAAHMTNGLAHHYTLGESTVICRGIGSNFEFSFYLMKILQANRIVPDGTPPSAASHLGLYCLPTSQK